MDKIVRYGIVFALGLLIFDRITSKGGESNGEVHSESNNVHNGSGGGSDSRKRTTNKGRNWYGITTEDYI